MILIPAIDLKEGRCVRLIQGEMRQATVYSEDPIAVANRWDQEGARRIHVVDLDGAIQGRPVHFEQIKEIIQTIPVEVQVGGGIRTLKEIEAYRMAGAAWIVLGTSILQNAPLVQEAVQIFPEKIIAGIDCKAGGVAIQGWVEVRQEDPIGLALRMQEAGVAAIILTDVAKDGMMAGPNFNLLQTMLAAVKIPVIVSGGVATMDDIRRLNAIPSLHGAIVGKALYSGALSYQEAVRVLQTGTGYAG
jgi:phosphoribosylformimino-5-aminoimidazole carboxamide ribotide isomerase